jgi:hypothetical protein
LLPKASRAQSVRECHLTAPGWQVLTPRCDDATRGAIADDPDVPLLPLLFGIELLDSGRFQEAAKMADMDLAENPLGPNQLTLRTLAAKMIRSSDEDDVAAALEARMHRYMGPGSTTYGDFATALANGDIRAADAVLQNSGADDGSAQNARLVLRGVSSKAPADVSAMRNSCDPAERQADSAFTTCLVGLALVGDLDRVFALAARGYRDVECCTAAQQEAQWLATGGDYYSRWPLFGKAMAPVRADRRFIELARRTGLLAYWKSGRPPDFCATERVPVCALLTQRR